MTRQPRVALYLRVSTDDQTCENQRLALAEAAGRHGWEVVAEFRDDGVSGSKGRAGRPGFDRLWRGIGRRDFDMVAAWSVDRLGRSMVDLVTLLVEMREKGVDLYLHQQGVDTSTAGGRAMFQMMGVFAEFERAMIVERTRAGLARAVVNGVRLGRPPVAPEVEAEVRELLAAGVGICRVARMAGCGVSTVQRIAGILHAAP